MPANIPSPITLPQRQRDDRGFLETFALGLLQQAPSIVQSELGRRREEGVIQGQQDAARQTLSALIQADEDFSGLASGAGIDPSLDLVSQLDSLSDPIALLQGLTSTLTTLTGKEQSEAAIDASIANAESSRASTAATRQGTQQSADLFADEQRIIAAQASEAEARASLAQFSDSRKEAEAALADKVSESELARNAAAIRGENIDQAASISELLIQTDQLATAEFNELVASSQVFAPNVIGLLDEFDIEADPATVQQLAFQLSGVGNGTTEDLIRFRSDKRFSVESALSSAGSSAEAIVTAFGRPIGVEDPNFLLPFATETTRQQVADNPAIGLSLDERREVDLALANAGGDPKAAMAEIEASANQDGVINPEEIMRPMLYLHFVTGRRFELDDQLKDRIKNSSGFRQFLQNFRDFSGRVNPRSTIGDPSPGPRISG